MNRTLAAVAAVLLALPVAGCRRDLPPAVAVYARGADSESLDPQGIDDGESAKVVENLYDGLVEFGPSSTRVVPDLAERWETAEGGLEWTFHLRSGVLFHDGTPCDGEAVVFTFRRLLEGEKGRFAPPKMPYGSFFSDHIESVTAPDAATVKFRLKHAYAPFLQNLAMFAACIVSPTAMKAQGAAAFAKSPVGTGPFRFVQWNHGEKKITLERNAAYWRGAPALDRVLFITIPDNNARLSALRSGACNWMDGVNPQDLAACRADPGLRVWTGTGMNVGYLAMNTGRKPFDDVRVRRAVGMALDRKRLVDALYLGAGVPASQPLPPGILGHDPAWKPGPPDVAGAKALLAEAGFPAGFETTLFCMPNPRPYFPDPGEIAQVLRSDLAAVGIRASIDNVGDWTQYLEAVQNAKHPMCMLGWTTDNGDPDNFLWTFFSDESARVGPGALNMAFWVDPEMQRLLREGQRETDPAKREGIYRAALAVVRDQVPMVPIAHAEQVFLSTAGFEGFLVQPTGDVLLYPVKPPPAE